MTTLSLRLKKFFEQWIKMVQTFPLANIILVALTAIAIHNAYHNQRENGEMVKMILSLVFALPLTILAPLSSLIKHKKVRFDFIYQLVGLVAGVGFYVLLPTSIEGVAYSTQITIIGTVVLAWLSLFLIPAIAYRNNEVSTRNAWRSIITSIIFGGIAGAIVRGGLSACVASIKYLFGVHTAYHIYEYIASISLIFIAGSITLINVLDRDADTYRPVYNRILRIFGHYIFLPLTIIYGLILISYGIKILITGVWPEGRLVYMVSGYVLFGLLTWYTTYIALSSKTIQKSHTMLFWSFLLTSLLMIKAIQLRVETYGITIDRYFVYMIIAWIIITSMLSLIYAKRRFLIMISTLISLGIITLYVSPLSAKTIAYKSQKLILQQQVIRHNISLPLSSGSLANVAIAGNDQLFGSLGYLVQNIEPQKLATLLPDDIIQQLQNTYSSYQRKNIVCKFVGQKECSDYYYDYDNREYFGYYPNNDTVSVDTTGYTKFNSINQDGLQTKNHGVITFGENNDTLDISAYLEILYTQSKDSTVGKSKGPYIINTDDKLIIILNMAGYKEVLDTDGTTTYTINGIMGYVFSR